MSKPRWRRIFRSTFAKWAWSFVDARIVVFAERRRPHEAAEGKWPAPWYKKAYKSVRPATWLSEYWRRLISRNDGGRVRFLERKSGQSDV